MQGDLMVLKQEKDLKLIFWQLSISQAHPPQFLVLLVLELTKVFQELVFAFQ
jgi:hypothetical protein